MRKIVILILAAVLVFPLAGCAPEKPDKLHDIGQIKPVELTEGEKEILNHFGGKAFIYSLSFDTQLALEKNIYVEYYQDGELIQEHPLLLMVNDRPEPKDSNRLIITFNDQPDVQQRVWSASLGGIRISTNLPSSDGSGSTWGQASTSRPVYLETPLILGFFITGDQMLAIPSGIFEEENEEFMQILYSNQHVFIIYLKVSESIK